MEFIHQLSQSWSHFTNYLEELLFWAMLAYGYRAVFFGVMLENAGLPVPGETILIVAGYFAANGHFKLRYVILTALIGAVIGDNIGFAVGRYFGRDFLLRYGRYLFLTPARVAAIDRFFVSHGNKTILWARFITGLRVFAALFAGSSKMPWRTFLAYNFAGAVIWSVVIATLGYIFAPSLHALERWVGRGGVILLVTVLIAAAIIWKIRRARKVAAIEATSKA
ncbi:MAG: DedA family protein [Pyrinomonadaceae bacterium]